MAEEIVPDYCIQLFTPNILLDKNQNSVYTCRYTCIYILYFASNSPGCTLYTESNKTPCCTLINKDKGIYCLFFFFYTRHMVQFYFKIIAQIKLQITAKFVNDQRQVGGFLWLLRFPPPIKLTSSVYIVAEILLKVTLNTINITNPMICIYIQQTNKNPCLTLDYCMIIKTIQNQEVDNNNNTCNTLASKNFKSLLVNIICYL